MVVRRQMSSTLPLCVLLGPLRDHRPHTHLTPPSPDQMDRSDHSSGRCGRTCTGHPLQPHISLLSQTCLEKIPLQVSPQEVTYQRRLSTRHTATQTHTSSSQSSSNYSNILVTSSYFLERNHPEDMNAAVITHTFDSTGGRNHGESLPKKPERCRATPTDTRAGCGDKFNPPISKKRKPHVCVCRGRQLLSRPATLFWGLFSLLLGNTYVCVCV